MSKTSIQYRVLYEWFPVVEAFAKRELPKQIAINTGHRVMKLRELFTAAEERRLLLVEKHAVMENDSPKMDEKGRVEMKDQGAFDKDWKGMLQSAIEGYPSFPKRFSTNDLPDDVTALEVEALLRLQLLDTPEVWS